MSAPNHPSRTPGTQTRRDALRVSPMSLWVQAQCIAPRAAALRLYQAHFFDYPAAAAACWLAIAGLGAAALVWAAASVWARPAAWPMVLLAVAAAAIASSRPVRIPRSKYALSTADLCTYIALATLGPAAAVLCAGADGGLGAWRTTRRLTSRVATPAAAMAAAGLAGLAFGGVETRWTAALGDAGATMAALGVAALLTFVGTTLPLTSMMALKRGQGLSLRDWAAACGWVGAVMLGTALVAGLVVLNARWFGHGLVAVVAVLVTASVALLRLSLARQEAEQSAQDAQLADARRDADMHQQRFMAAFTHAAAGMAIVDEDQRTLLANRALAQIMGVEETALSGQDFRLLLHPGDVALFERMTRQADALPEQGFSVQLRCRRDDGDVRWVALHCSRFVDPIQADAATAGAQARRSFIYQVHDITSRYLAEQRLQHIAYHDSLTDLANRACFAERLKQAVELQRSDPGRHFAVLFLDLDRFKVVNDSLGHQAGNELLCVVADRLRANARPLDLVARLGGDEFAILCDALDQPAQAHALAARVSAALAQPLAVRGTEVVPGASIGLTLSQAHPPRSVDEVLRDADLAMYEAKGAGRGRVVVFDASMHERIADRLALEADLRHAIGEGKLSAAFQPIFELADRRLAGFEALARWHHPERGAVPPDVFIKLAEESGHIEAVTRWIIDHAAGQLAAWRGSHASRRDLCVNVNISGRDLAGTALAAHVREVLHKHALRALGVRLSIDDFGTGYSSLAYLSTLPFDSLKIDRSFVGGMAKGAQNVEIVRTVLRLGHTLGKVVVAEGIETAAQLQQLRRLGVDRGQGYLLSRPLTAAAALELLDSLAPAALALQVAA